MSSEAIQLDIFQNIGKIQLITSVKLSLYLAPNLYAYKLDVLSATTSYPYGEEIPALSYEKEAYDYGFTGHKKDNALGKGLFTTLYREYDTKNPRWWSVDPLRAKYPSISPYAYCGGNPISSVDYNGDSISLGNLTEKDANGNLKYRSNVQAFEAFAMTKEGREWILDRAQKGFSYTGQIYQDLNINASEEGYKSKAGIDYDFSACNLGHLGETKAKIKENGRVGISVALSNTWDIDHNPNYNYYVESYNKLGTFLHESWYHGNLFVGQYFSGNYKRIGDYIYAGNHVHSLGGWKKNKQRIQMSLDNSLFGQKGFKILQRLNLQYSLGYDKEKLLSTMRIGFHEVVFKKDKNEFNSHIKTK